MYLNRPVGMQGFAANSGPRFHLGERGQQNDQRGIIEFTAKLLPKEFGCVVISNTTRET